MSPETRQRLLIRTTLVAGMLLAGLGLFAVIKHKSGGGSAAPAPALSRHSLRVKVVDRSGRVVKDANAFVKTAGGAEPAQARWSPKDGVLMLPKRERAHDLRVIARGYQVKDVAGVDADRTITLERGLRLRVRVLDVPRDGVPERVRVMLRVHPLDLDEDAPEALDAEAVVSLMDNLGGPGPKNIDRRRFGYLVSLEQAKRGILVPRAGRYHVRWGLFQFARKQPQRTGTRERNVGTWQGSRGRDVDVDGNTTLELAVTLDDLQLALDALERVASAKGK